MMSGSVRVRVAPPASLLRSSIVRREDEFLGELRRKRGIVRPISDAAAAAMHGGRSQSECFGASEECIPRHRRRRRVVQRGGEGRHVCNR